MVDCVRPLLRQIAVTRRQSILSGMTDWTRESSHRFGGIIPTQLSYMYVARPPIRRCLRITRGSR